MTLVKSLAPLATHLLDAISCHSVHSILDLNITSCASRTLSINLASLPRHTSWKVDTFSRSLLKITAVRDRQIAR